MLRLMSVLLEYPEHDLIEAVPELRARVAQENELDEAGRDLLNAFLRYVQAADLTELQADYVQTFDLTPEHSLHLTHHLFGEESGRGPALIDLTEYYRAHGFEIAVGELPDYLPLVLEFASQLEVDESRLFLSRISKIVTQLAMNLEQANSPYAPLLRVVERMTRLVVAAA